MTADQMALIHGVTRDDFWGRQFDIYMRNLVGGETRQVGVTEAEVTLSLGYEYMEFFRGQPRNLFISRISQVDLSLTFTFKQFDPVLIGLSQNGELVVTDPDLDNVFLGTEPAEPLELTWWFISELNDGRPIQFCVRVGIIQKPEDLPTGTGEFAGMPVTLRALADENICDKQRNLAYWCVGKLEVPSGGFVDPCAAEDPTPCEPD